MRKALKRKSVNDSLPKTSSVTPKSPSHIVPTTGISAELAKEGGDDDESAKCVVQTKKMRSAHDTNISRSRNPLLISSPPVSSSTSTDNAPATLVHHTNSAPKTKSSTRRSTPQSRETWPNGTRETWPNGTRETWPNGTRETWPNGTRETWPNGTRETWPNGTPRLPKYFMKKDVRGGGGGDVVAENDGRGDKASSCGKEHKKRVSDKVIGTITNEENTVALSATFLLPTNDANEIGAIAGAILETDAVLCADDTEDKTTWGIKTEGGDDDGDAKSEREHEALVWQQLLDAHANNNNMQIVAEVLFNDRWCPALVSICRVHDAEAAIRTQAWGDLNITLVHYPLSTAAVPVIHEVRKTLHRLEDRTSLAGRDDFLEVVASPPPLKSYGTGTANGRSSGNTHVFSGNGKAGVRTNDGKRGEGGGGGDDATNERTTTKSQDTSLEVGIFASGDGRHIESKGMDVADSMLARLRKEHLAHGRDLDIYDDGSDYYTTCFISELLYATQLRAAQPRTWTFESYFVLVAFASTPVLTVVTALRRQTQWEERMGACLWFMALPEPHRTKPAWADAPNLLHVNMHKTAHFTIDEWQTRWPSDATFVSALLDHFSRTRSPSVRFKLDWCRRTFQKRQPHQLLFEFAHSSVVARLCLAQLSPPLPITPSVTSVRSLNSNATTATTTAISTSNVVTTTSTTSTLHQDGIWCAWQHLLTNTPHKNELLCTLLNDFDACYLPSVVLVRFLLHQGLRPADLLCVDTRRIGNMETRDFDAEIDAMSDLKVYLCVAAPYTYILPEPVLALIHGYLPWFDNLHLNNTRSLEIHVHRLSRRVVYLEHENLHFRTRLTNLEHHS
jgi:hypothetical protein